MPFGRAKVQAPLVSDFAQQLTSTPASPRSEKLGTVSFYRRTPKSLALTGDDIPRNRSPNYKLRLAPSECACPLWVQLHEQILPYGEWASKMRSGQLQWDGCPTSLASSAMAKETAENSEWKTYQASLVTGNAPVLSLPSMPDDDNEVEEDEMLSMLPDDQEEEFDPFHAVVADAAAALLTDEEAVAAKIFDGE
eukprot:Tamp_22952.p1 GENE.Tamp_22952~~Tamp_22952.p1  ORF type:complete len:194 (+),score=22.77 Tamp_22952:66-647(+)